LGAAKAIVKTKMEMVAGVVVHADYSPSIKPESEHTESVDDELGDRDRVTEGVDKAQEVDKVTQEVEKITIATVSVPVE
jgi:hypothetical protein